MLWESRPALRSPVLIAAFHGWNDGGSAATLAASFVRSTLDATRFATIDPDDYIDFQQTRPRVSLSDGLTREISWPEIEFFQAALPGTNRDIVICIGTEPNLRWKAFTNEIADLAAGLGVDLALTLGGLLADTPHTRPVPVTGAAHDGNLAERLGLRRSRYEGPTGIVGVLHDTFARREVPSASLWAAVPHYIAANTNPAAALALVRQLEGILDVQLHPDELGVGVGGVHAPDPAGAGVGRGDGGLRAGAGAPRRRRGRRGRGDPDRRRAGGGAAALPAGAARPPRRPAD